MKKFGIILQFELSNYVKNKTLIGFTAVFVILTALFLFSPGFFNFSDIFSRDNDDTQTTHIMISTEIADEDDLYAFFDTVFYEDTIEFTKGDFSLTTMQDAVKNEEYDSGIMVHSPESYTTVVQNKTLFDTVTQKTHEALKQYFQISTMETHGMNSDEAIHILTASPVAHMIVTGKNQETAFFYTYILIMVLYMSILLYGNFVATGVVTEKTSRAMEVLITGAKPADLMFGKIMGAAITGCIQLLTIFGSAFIFFNINKEYWIDNALIQSIFNIPPAFLLYMLLFFVCGFFIYAFLFGAAGSCVTKLEDVSTMTMPVTMCFIAAFVITMVGMSSGNVDSTLIKICSFIPLTSPLLMFVRITMGSVASAEIIISVLILIVSTIFIGFLSAKIYRMGVLLYGNTPTLKTIYRALKTKG
ncbi:MAG: ABC transporter permease [Spirochaetales bacterium]